MSKSVKLWRYNKTCEFGHFGLVQNPNGTYSENNDSFIRDYKRKCANYYITPSMIQDLEGLEIKDTLAIAVKQLRNDPLTSPKSYGLYVRYRGNLYTIKSIKFGAMELVGRIIFVLEKTDKPT